MGDLLLHTTLIWLNPSSSLGKWKKEPQLATFGTSRTPAPTSRVPFYLFVVTFNVMERPENLFVLVTLGHRGTLREVLLQEKNPLCFV